MNIKNKQIDRAKISDLSPFTITNKSHSWSFFKPADPELYLNKISDKEFEKDKFLPYWAEFWPASEALFTYLFSSKQVISGTMCELGTGLGIISALCSTFVESITATDISYESCTYANYNIASMNTKSLNNLVVCCDWRASPFQCKFNWIVGADILYESRWRGPVSQFIASHLSQKGRAIISDPQRKSWDSFKKGLSSYGLYIKNTTRHMLSTSKTPIEVIEIQKT